MAQPTCWPAPGPPAILFEFNPITLAQCGEDVDTLAANLRGHILYYVDDFRAQMLPFGEMVENLRKISWICNMFAVPSRLLKKLGLATVPPGRRSAPTVVWTAGT